MNKEPSLGEFQTAIAQWAETPLEYLVINFLWAADHSLWQTHHTMVGGTPQSVVEFLGTPTIFQDLVRQLVIIARFAGVNLEEAVWQKFPDICPYCGRKPCECAEKKSSPHEELSVPKSRSFTADELRVMLAEIYPPARARDKEYFYFQGKIIEEAHEVLEVLRSPEHREREDELADLFARVAEVATVKGIPLAC